MLIADWVLPVHQMPEKLIHFKESSERLHLTNGADPQKIAEEINADESLREILTLLRVRTGHDFSNYKTPTLVRRIARQLQIHELEDIPSYLELLRNTPGEIQSLLKNLLINVTNFVRDKSAFDALEAQVIPNLFDGKTSKDAVRVWSCGCASGEEAFSLAMLLSEYADTLPDPPKIQVFASDVDDDAIAEAREHRYPETIEADVSPERLKRFFVKEGAFYRVKKELRETVLFAPHNVLRDPPFSRLDLISCRNLLIYLNRETQERVLQIFHFALASNGYMFLGSSETAESTTTLYAPVDKKHRIYSRRAAPVAQNSLPVMPVIGRWEVRIPERKSETLRERAATLGEIHYRLLENYAPSSILVNQDFDIVYLSGTAGKFLRFSGGEPSRNLLKAINPDLLPDLRAALFTAQREHKSSEFPNVRVTIEGEERVINLIVRAVDVKDEARDFLLVIFEEKNSPAVIRETEREISKITNKDEAMETVVRRLEEDLQRTKEHLRFTIEQHETTVEELKASNEELQAINEELRSASEELETSKEELTTVNHELKDKIDEASRINADLSNLMAATDIATIFLDKNLRIKRYTPPVEEFFNITKADVGRPLEHFTHKLNYDNLARDAEKVLKKLAPFEHEITDKNGRQYLARFAPYRTLDDRIEGVVLNFIDVTESNRAEIALRESEELFRLASDAVPSVIYDWNVQEDKIIRSHELENLLGFSPDDPQTQTNKWWKTRLHPDDAKEAVEKVVEKLKSNEYRFEDEYRLQHLDGYYIWVSDTGVLLRDENGKVTRWIGNATNITKRKEAEEALAESEAHFRAIVNQNLAGIFEIDLNGKIVFANDEFCRMLGYECGTLAELPMEKYIHAEDLPLSLKKIERMQKDKKAFDMEKRFIRQDGSVIWVHNSISPIKSGGRKITSAVIVSLDITDRQTASEHLRKSEEQLQLILESTKDYSIITFDLEGFITRWNSGAERMFGYTEDEMVGRKGDVLFTPEDRKANVPAKEFETARKKGRAEDERWHLRKDGSRFFASGVMQPLRDGKLEGFVKIARDQTEKLRVETALHEQEMLRQFVRTQEDERRRIARDLHDQLGQQLTALRFKIAGLKKMCAKMDIPEKESAAAQIDELQKTNEQLDRDVDFLAWELRPASLEDLGLRLTLQNFVKEWAAYTGVNAAFHTAGIGKIHLNDEIETNLYRIAQESLNNINKHAKATLVSVLLEKRGDTLVLIVEDNGIGFDVEKIGKRRSGQGLGLVGMRERAKIINGETEIESKKGAGTTIYVRVPVETKK